MQIQAERCVTNNVPCPWLANLGLEWYKCPLPVSGKGTLHNDPIGRYRVKGHGRAICRVLGAAASQRGIDILYQTRAKKILTNDQGKIVGLRAERKGQDLEFETKSIVLATGGFQGNRNMVATYITPLLTKARLSGNPLNTGDGHLMAMELGAHMANTNQCHASLRNRHRLNPYPRLQYASLLVDVQGRRFVDETKNTKDYIAKELLLKGGGRGAVIFGENMKSAFREGYEEHLREYSKKRYTSHKENESIQH